MGRGPETKAQEAPGRNSAARIAGADIEDKSKEAVVFADAVPGTGDSG